MKYPEFPALEQELYQLASEIQSRHPSLAQDVRSLLASPAYASRRASDAGYSDVGAFLLAYRNSLLRLKSELPCETLYPSCPLPEIEESGM